MKPRLRPKKCGCFVFAFCLAALISACASTSEMTLEKAKQISISMQEKPFVPPPRVVSDILAVLDMPGNFDGSIKKTVKAAADQLPPTDAEDWELAGFYESRGWAARDDGRLMQALDDLRKALEYASKTGSSRGPVIKFRLGVVEKSIGNYKRAIELLKESTRESELTTAYMALVSGYITIGDLESARKTKDEGITLCNRIRAMTGATSRPDALELYIWADADAATMEASVLEAQASFWQAEPYRRKKLNAAFQVKNSHQTPIITARRLLSQNLLGQGRLTEAEIEAREAIDEAIGLAGRDSVITAEALLDLGLILKAQGRLEDARVLAEATIKLLNRINTLPDSHVMCSAQMMLGDVLFLSGDFLEAATQYDKAKDAMKANRYLFDRHFSRNREFLMTLILVGRVDEAMDMLSRAYNLEIGSYPEEHAAIVELVALRAMAKAAADDQKGALEDFSAAAPVLVEGGKRDLWTRSILEAYLTFLSKLHGSALEKEAGIDSAAEAFRIVNVIGGRAVQSALNDSTARAAASFDPDLVDLVRREQDAKKQISALQEILFSALAAPPDQQDANAQKTLNESISSLTGARTTLLEEIKLRFPKYQEFTNPKPVSISAARQALCPGEAIINLYTSDEKTFVWAVPHTGEITFKAVPIGRKLLSEMVTTIRYPLDNYAKTFGEIPDFDVVKAYELYDKLLRSTEISWRDSTDLLMVVHGPLGQLPLSILPTAPITLGTEKGQLFARYRKVPWLIRKASLTMLPSLNVLIALRNLPMAHPMRKAFAGFGNPIFNLNQLSESTIPSRVASTRGVSGALAGRGADLQIRGIRISDQGKLDSKKLLSSQLTHLHRLPDTEEEVRAIAEVLGADQNLDVFLGKDASENKVKTINLADRKVISFATHALVPGDLDGLDQPALALSSPEVTVDGEDGLLKMGEILRLKLNADWVVLSACNTGAAEGQGAEAVSGLGRAFFYAGTRALLVTMWSVETTSAKKLVMETFRLKKENKDLTRTQALRKSMLEMIDKASFLDPVTNEVVASYAHPLFWAPFILVGDPGAF